MGFEVIDEHGTAQSGPSAPVDLPRHSRGVPPTPLDPVETGSGGRPPAEHGTPGPPSRLRRTAERAAGHPSLLLVGAVLVGTLVGGLFVQQFDQGRADARARGVLLATARAENQFAGGTQGVRTARLTVRLTNLGPAPLTPVVSADGSVATATDPVVQASHPGLQALPGGDAVVTMEVPLPCGQDLPPVWLPVRTADGRVHHLAVQGTASEVLRADQTMCQSPASDQPVVDATLDGTVERPVLVLSNRSAQARKVWLDRSTDPPDIPAALVHVRLTPTLPAVVDPHGELRVRLQVTADQCVRDVGRLEGQQRYSWLAFSETAPDRTSPPTGPPRGPSSGVSISALVTDALLLACR